MGKYPDKESKKEAVEDIDRELSSSNDSKAEGIGDIAQRILQEAHYHNLPVLQIEKLLKSLNNLNVLEEIPPDLVPAIEEILKYLNKMDLRKGMDSR
jgi:flagellar biosynthesis protein